MDNKPMGFQPSLTETAQPIAFSAVVNDQSMIAVALTFRLRFGLVAGAPVVIE